MEEWLETEAVCRLPCLDDGVRVLEKGGRKGEAEGVES